MQIPRELAATCITIAITTVLYCLSDALVPFFVGVSVSYICIPFVSILNKKLKLGLQLSTGLCIVIAYVSLGILFATSMPFLYRKLLDITISIRGLDIARTLRSMALHSKQESTHVKLLIQSFDVIKTVILSKAPGYITYVVRMLLSSTQSLIGIIFSMIFAPMVSFYFIKDIYYRRNLPGVVKYCNNLAYTFIQIQIVMISIYWLYYFIIVQSLGLKDSDSPIIGPKYGST